MTGFWQWALESYARPGAAEACLALQNEHGQNVPLVLWVVWASRASRPPDIARGAALARAWEAAAVAPLRAARRSLRSPVADLPDDARERFRAEVKATELAGERVLMDALEALPPSGEAPAKEDALLAAAAQSWGAPAPPEVFELLLGRL